MNMYEIDKAYAPTVHLQRKYGTSPACGRSSDETTTDYREVTCGSCQRTEAYGEATNADRTAQRDAEGQILAKVQEAINEVASALHDWANEAGHCETYDEAVSEANMVLNRRGLSWPERKIKFMLRIRHEEIEADDEDEALEIIARNIRTWVQVS